VELTRQPTLSRSVHDRATAYRTDAGWQAAAWPRARVLRIAPDGTVPVIGMSGDASAGWPIETGTVVPGEDLGEGPRLSYAPSSQVPAEAERYFLGEYDGVPYYAVAVPEPGAREADSTGISWRGLRELGAVLPDLDSGLLVAAVGLAAWHSRHPRCPRCGEPTVATQAGWARHCDNDGSDHWPRTDPAVIMLVHDGDRCILGRAPSWPEGRYSILAGFVEPGESLEAAVAREVAEEVGVAVTDVRYLASQPWPFPASLMLGFTALLDGDPTIRLKDGELAEARWFTRAEVRQHFFRLPPSVSIAHRIITDWAAL
jgi:NAD+ diphosphatase